MGFFYYFSATIGAMLTLTVNSTHFYLIDCRGGKLLVDAGWELARFTSQLKAYRIPITEIRYVMFTHHHPDHAGLVQQIRAQAGARLIIHEQQIPFLAQLNAYAAKMAGSQPLRVEPGDLVSPDRAALGKIGISGEILETPGHSADSISLLLEGGAAFIGDLPSPAGVGEEQLELTRDSWRRLIAHGAQVFYHSHTDPIPLETIQRLLPG